MCKSTRERQAACSGLMRRYLRGHRPLAETVSPLVTHKRRLGDVCAQRTQQPEDRNFPGSAPPPPEAPWKRSSLCRCDTGSCQASLPCLPLSPWPQALAAPWARLTTGCLEMAGPGVTTSQTLTHEPPLGPFRGVPRRALPWAPSIFCCTPRTLACWKALWGHTGGGLALSRHSGSHSVTGRTGEGVGSRPSPRDLGTERKRSPQCCSQGAPIWEGRQQGCTHYFLLW